MTMGDWEGPKDSSLDPATQSDLALAGSTGIGTIDFFGHSMSTFGGTNPLRANSMRTGAMLHAEVRDFSINGAVHTNHDIGTAFLHTYNGDGGWAHVYRYAAPEAHAAPYTSRRNAAVLFTGINDVVVLGMTNIQTPFKNALRSSISRLRAAAVFEHDHASVTLGGGGWSTQTPTWPIKRSSGTTYTKATSGVNDVTIAVPSDFPGGTVTVSFLAGADGKGALFNCMVDGGAAQQVETRSVQPKNVTTNTDRNMWTPVVKRFTGLAAGSHTIVIAINALSTECYFDCWWIEAPNPPLINVPLAPYTDGITYPSNANVDTLDTYIASVVSEFDANVFSTDLRTVTNNSTDLVDGIHFNDQGHRKVAAAYVADFLAIGRRRSAALEAEGNAQGSGLIREPASYYDPVDPLADRANIIQPTRPNVIALTLRNNDFTTPEHPLMRVEGRDGSLLASIENQGSMTAPTFTAGTEMFSPAFTAGDAKLWSFYGVPILNLGTAAISATNAGKTLVLSGSDPSLPSTILQTVGASPPTNDIVQFKASTTLKGKFDKDGALRLLANPAFLVPSFAIENAIGDTWPMFGIYSGTTIAWGPGGASAVDVSLTRDAAGELTTDAQFSARHATKPAFKVKTGHGSGAAFDANSEGKGINFVDPTAAQDLATKNYVDGRTPSYGTFFAADHITAPGSTVTVANTAYYSQVLVLGACTLTGIQFFSFAASGTAKVALFNSAGTRLFYRNAASATLSVGTIQVAFDTGGPYTLTPGLYFAEVVFSAAVNIGQAASIRAGSVAVGSYANAASITPPNVSAAVPAMSTY